MFFIILFIVLALYGFFILKSFYKAKKMPKDTVICFTGGLGTGKTLIAVNQAIKAYRKTLLLWKLGRYKYKDEAGKKKNVEMPLFYSNIPIMIKMPFFIKGPKKQFSYMLDYDHILLKKIIKEYSVIMIDEVGSIANQYSYDNPFVRQFVEELFRFFRHIVDGRIFLTDQSSGNIAINIRRRLNIVYNLHEFKRDKLFFYKVNVVSVVQIDEAQTTLEMNKEEEFPYMYGYLPFKFFKKLDPTRFFTYKKYESRVYKYIYDDYLQDFNDPISFNDFYTKYLIRIPNTKIMKDDFKKQGFLTQNQMEKYYNEFIENFEN